MEFRLDQDQLELQDTVRRFCAARFPLDRIARRDGERADAAAWREMAELGIFAMLVPAAEGGAGLGAVGAVIVFEQLGASLATGPVLWSALAAPYLAGVASGDRRAGGIEADDAPLLVEHAAEIDALLILRPDGVFACEGADLPARERVAALDPLTPVGRLSAAPRGARVGDTREAAELRRTGVVLCAAMLLGVASTALECSRRHALDREQFGVPIGSFQAIQHILADMYVRSALARSATYAAAAVLDDPEAGDPLRAAAIAKLLAGEAALENARAAVQVHGGLGFTWDALPNYLLKRAWVLEHAFGNTDSHALAIGASIEAA